MGAREQPFTESQTAGAQAFTFWSWAAQLMRVFEQLVLNTPSTTQVSLVQALLSLQFTGELEHVRVVGLQTEGLQ
jgi:hypothetical protein